MWSRPDRFLPDNSAKCRHVPGQIIRSFWTCVSFDCGDKKVCHRLQMRNVWNYHSWSGQRSPIEDFFGSVESVPKFEEIFWILKHSWLRKVFQISGKIFESGWVHDKRIPKIAGKDWKDGKTSTLNNYWLNPEARKMRCCLKFNKRSITTHPLTSCCKTPPAINELLTFENEKGKMSNDVAFDKLSRLNDGVDSNSNSPLEILTRFMPSEFVSGLLICPDDQTRKTTSVETEICLQHQWKGQIGIPFQGNGHAHPSRLSDFWWGCGWRPMCTVDTLYWGLSAQTEPTESLFVQRKPCTEVCRLKAIHTCA